MGWPFRSWLRLVPVNGWLGALGRLRPVLLELPPEQVMVGGFAGETVAVLRQHHRDAAGGHQVPNSVYAGPLQPGAALTSVLHLLDDLVPFAGGVVSQGFYLLG
jgi:hypothetical protein